VDNDIGGDDEIEKLVIAGLLRVEWWIAVGCHRECGNENYPIMLLQARQGKLGKVASIAAQ
jgi:hypothetical protein